MEIENKKKAVWMIIGSLYASIFYLVVSGLKAFAHWVEMFKELIAAHPIPLDQMWLFLLITLFIGLYIMWKVIIALFELIDCMFEIGDKLSKSP